MSVSVTEFGALTATPVNVQRRRLRLDAERRARSEVIVGPHAGEQPVDHRAHLGDDRLQRLAVPDGVTDRGPANRERHHVACGWRAGEDHRGVRIGRVDAPPLVVPEDAHVHVGVALEPELLELPEVPGRRLLVAVVGVEVDGERHVRIVLRRVRNVLRHRAARGNRSRSSTRCWRRSWSNSGGDLDGVVARRHAAAHLQIRRGAAVLVEVEIVRGCHAIHGDADLAAVGVQERPEVEIVLARVRVPERDLANVPRVRGRGALRVARCSTTATGKPPRRTCSPPKSRCTCTARPPPRSAPTRRRPSGCRRR